jgi:hypothetical protein
MPVSQRQNQLDKIGLHWEEEGNILVHPKKTTKAHSKARVDFFKDSFIVDEVVQTVDACKSKRVTLVS